MNGTMESNQGTINWVTRTLCILAFILGSAICLLAYFKIEIPSELNTLAGIVIGGLLSMLTKTTPTQSAPAKPHEEPAAT